MMMIHHIENRFHSIEFLEAKIKVYPLENHLWTIKACECVSEGGRERERAKMDLDLGFYLHTFNYIKFYIGRMKSKIQIL